MKSQPSNELKSAISEGLIWAEGTTSKLTYMTLQFLIVKASPLGHHRMVFPRASSLRHTRTHAHTYTHTHAQLKMEGFFLKKLNLESDTLSLLLYTIDYPRPTW